MELNDKTRKALVGILEDLRDLLLLLEGDDKHPMNHRPD